MEAPDVAKFTEHIKRFSEGARDAVLTFHEDSLTKVSDGGCVARSLSLCVVLPALF